MDVLAAAVDLGGGPVPSEGALPGDGDGDVAAEQAGQDGGGRSVVSWNSAAEPAGPEQIPSWRRRPVSWKALMIAAWQCTYSCR